MDFTEALVPRAHDGDRRGVLQRLTRDAEQLALIERVVDGWPNRRHVSAARQIHRDIVVSAVTRSAIEHSVVTELVHAVQRDHGATALLFNVHTSWRPPNRPTPPRGGGLTAQQLDAYLPETAIVEACGIVIPDSGQGSSS